MAKIARRQPSLSENKRAKVLIRPDLVPRHLSECVPELFYRARVLGDLDEQTRERLVVDRAVVGDERFVDPINLLVLRRGRGERC